MTKIKFYTHSMCIVKAVKGYTVMYDFFRILFGEKRHGGPYLGQVGTVITFDF